MVFVGRKKHAEVETREKKSLLFHGLNAGVHAGFCISKGEL